MKFWARKLLGPAGYDRLVRHRSVWTASRSYAKWKNTAEGSRTFKSLSSLRFKEKGRRIFIIGNGPSLKDTNLRELKGEITIGCNALFLHFDQMGFVPTYYTLEDRLVAEDRGSEIARIRNTTKVFPLDLKQFVPDSNVLWINFLRYYPGFPGFSDNLSERAFWGGTVTYLSIQLAVYLGSSSIFLVGMDHNYKTDINLVKTGLEWKSLEDDPNHFHPDYFGKGFRWHDPMVDRMEVAYRKALVETEKRGVKVFNATVGGKLEVFPRVCFDELFSND